ncbi:MAG: ACR3 family arsenite efflux transporter [Bacteroidetes bacterium]|nr:ACR3 family arsenite efflux transporter [Bacteroidota bacterium]
MSILSKKMSFFERHLTMWVFVCMVVGVGIGYAFPGFIGTVRSMEITGGSQINIPIMILIWLMIYPMMLKIDFTSIKNAGKKPKGLMVTLFVNWIVKPFSMAFLGWLFFKWIFAGWIPEATANEFLAGVIILAAAPCTAMVFVWSQLTDGDPAYTLIQVSVNDLIMLFAFAPIISFLVSGAAGIHIPFEILLYSVIAFIVIPLAAGSFSRWILIRTKGKEWFETVFIPQFGSVTISALLVTLVIIFAFQSDNILSNSFYVVLIAIPILIQVYFNSSLTYLLMRALKVEYAIAAPGALIGASNFFELAVATAIALFGPDSGAALATVVGVLVEVPVMLSVCQACNRTKHWFGDFSPQGR